MNGNKRCLIYGARQIVQVVVNRQKYVRFADNMKNLHILEEDKDKGNLNIVSIGGIIQFVGYENDKLFDKYRDSEFDNRYDATGCCILPGFIDSHTHPVWEGDRVHEFQMKLAGATYMQIHEAGGGIHFTVSHTKNASEQQLFDSLIDRLTGAMKTGTTFVECKTGYGLEWETELKMLQVLTRANRDKTLSKPNMSITYLAAHSIPIGKTCDTATDDIVNHQIPQLKSQMDLDLLDVDNIDVFCEKGVFEVDHTKRILEAGKNIGLQINFHGDELYPLNSVEMGVEIGSKGVSHLEEISDSEIEKMAKSETAAVLLPTTAYILRLKQPPARKMIDSGCIVALGSDFNPNAYCYSMPLVMHIACINMKMSLSEALIASTINSAFCLGVESTRGSIEVGKSADLVLVKANKWEHIVYQMGCHDKLIKYVFVDGNLVHSTQ